MDSTIKKSHIVLRYMQLISTGEHMFGRIHRLGCFAVSPMPQPHLIFSQGIDSSELLVPSVMGTKEARKQPDRCVHARIALKEQTSAETLKAKMSGRKEHGLSSSQITK